jgi:hypothetical protein
MQLCIVQLFLLRWLLHLYKIQKWLQHHLLAARFGCISLPKTHFPLCFLLFVLLYRYHSKNHLPALTAFLVLFFVTYYQGQRNLLIALSRNGNLVICSAVINYVLFVFWQR